MEKYLFLISLICLSCTGNKKQQEAIPDWKLEGFAKADSLNPIMKPSDELVFNCPVSRKEVHWEGRNVFNPAAVVKDGKVYLLYRAQDDDMTSRIGMAVSEDGLHFTKRPEPVLFPDNDSLNRYEWKGGVEDPRIVMSPERKYLMTYTAYDGKTARLCLATSDDLIHWEKHGLVLSRPEYRDTWSKSGAIVSRLEGNDVIADKINGKYWMYFGDTDLFIAYSDELLHWTVAEDSERGKMIRVLNPRPGYFDSRLVEPGPFALERDSGILLIYNSSNAANYNDPSLPEFTYAAGQALFSKGDPVKLIQRSAEYFIHPDKPYEKTGEVNEVCFVEGLVRFREHWFLYYGTADSRIAVAVR